MTTVEAAIVARLGSQSAVTDLVSTRIYPVRAPQNTTMPYITYQRISTAVIEGFGGADCEYPRFQINAWAEDYDTAIAARNAARAALNLWSDPDGTPAISRAIADGAGADDDDEESGAHRAMFDVQILHGV